MSDRKILFVVEGLNDEPKFIRKLLQVCYSSQQFKTYSYKTNIHVLAKRLKNEYPNFENEDIDIQKEGKDIMIGFNPKFILDALRVIDDEEITMYLVNPKAPFIIKNDEQSYIYLVLPISFNM